MGSLTLDLAGRWLCVQVCFSPPGGSGQMQSYVLGLNIQGAPRLALAIWWENGRGTGAAWSSPQWRLSPLGRQVS